MRRRLVNIVGGLVGLGIVAIASPSVVAASPAVSPIAMDLFILMPDHQALAIYQEVVVQNSSRGSVEFGIIPQARDVRGLGFSVARPSASQLVAFSHRHHLAIRYRIPWNGSADSVSVTNDAPTEALVVLVPESLSVPEVLNPALQYMGSGNIPGVPAGPKFQEYVTNQLGQGQSVPLVLEKAPTTATPPQPSRSGNHPVAAALFEVMVVVIGLGALLLGLYWRPIDHNKPHRLTANTLDQLAEIWMQHQKGFLSDDGYQESWKRIVMERGEN